MSSGTLHTLPLKKIFEIARDTGFDGIEIIINHDFRFADNAGLVRDLQQILPVMSLHAPFFQIVYEVLLTTTILDDHDGNTTMTKYHLNIYYPCHQTNTGLRLLKP